MKIFLRSALTLAVLLSASSRGLSDMLREPILHISPVGGTLKAQLLRTQHADGKLPLVIFLHGAGERGNDNEAQLKHGAQPLMAWLEKNNVQALALFPQCPANSKWVDVDWAAPSHVLKTEPTPELRMVMEIVEDLQKQGRVDENRVYIGGISMGGFGTWDMLAREPDRFAAAFPICGGGDPNTVSRYKNVPIWVFHGAKDGVVKPLRSREMVTALKEIGGNVEYTEYPDLQHDSWTRTFENDDFWAWLFARKRK